MRKKPACCCQLSAADRERSHGPGGRRDLQAPQDMYSTDTQQNAHVAHQMLVPTLTCPVLPITPFLSLPI